MADIPPYPLYNRTYHLFRASPLHHGEGPLLDDKALRHHAKRLKEQLKGDNVRGVQVDFASAEQVAKLGPLEECSWELIGDEDAWIDRHVQAADPDASQLSATTTPGRARGIQVSLEYEKQSYNALLLRDPGVTQSPQSFTSLPLMLVKMPGPIRDIFLDYMRTSFDAYVAPLKLSSSFVTSSLETYFRNLSASTSTQSIQDVVRQLQVQLSFPDTTVFLKHIEVTIAGSDVSGFVSRGKLSKDARDKPFTTALSSYLQKHLAIDILHSKVQISRIQCNSFTLANERLKLLAPDTLADASFSDEGGATQDASAGQLAVQEFYVSLVKEATGTGKLLHEELATHLQDDKPASTASRTVDRRKRAVSNAAPVAQVNKKAKGRGKENA